MASSCFDGDYHYMIFWGLPCEEVGVDNILQICFTMLVCIVFIIFMNTNEFIKINGVKE